MDGVVRSGAEADMGSARAVGDILLEERATVRWNRSLCGTLRLKQGVERDGEETN
jgi:hypothetical protein